jgi:hypothetical protein
MNSSAPQQSTQGVKNKYMSVQTTLKTKLKTIVHKTSILR